MEIHRVFVSGRSRSPLRSHYHCRKMEKNSKRTEMATYLKVQFSSVAQSCPTLCDPMNYSTPGLPVHHQLPEFTQTHLHRVSDAIQPSHPLSSPSPPAPNPSSIRVFSNESTLYLVIILELSRSFIQNMCLYCLMLTNLLFLLLCTWYAGCVS